MTQKPKPIYRLYVAAVYGGNPEWELYSPHETVAAAWIALDSYQHHRTKVWPCRIVKAVLDPENEDDDHWSGGDETFIDEKGCGLDELKRLISIGEVDY